MEKKKKKILLGILIFILIIGIAGAGAVYYYLFAPQFHPQRQPISISTAMIRQTPYIIR